MDNATFACVYFLYSPGSGKWSLKNQWTEIIADKGDGQFGRFFMGSDDEQAAWDQGFDDSLYGRT
jgi:hypothetical protein